MSWKMLLRLSPRIRTEVRYEILRNSEDPKRWWAPYDSLMKIGCWIPAPNEDFTAEEVEEWRRTWSEKYPTRAKPAFVRKVTLTFNRDGAITQQDYGELMPF
jgi:hypothetical protein